MPTHKMIYLIGDGTVHLITCVTLCSIVIAGTEMEPYSAVSSVLNNWRKDQSFYSRRTAESHNSPQHLRSSVNFPNVSQGKPIARSEEYNASKLFTLLNESQTSHLWFSNLTDLNSSTVTTSAYSTPVAVVLGIVTVSISIITVVGNLLVLASFLVERTLRTASNYFIASLAATDVLIGIFSMNLYTLYLVIGEWPLGRLSCDLWLTLDYTACLTSQYTVLFITVDRFFSVRLPAKYRNWRTDRKVSIMVAVTWIIPISVFCPIIMAWGLFHKGHNPRPSNKCYAEFANDPIFNTVFTLCYFWLTLCVMIGLYAGIYRVAASLQQRSDAKRNRVSGLVSAYVKETHVSTSDGTPMNGMDSQARQSGKQSKSRPGQYNCDNIANESSGFDSDEDIRYPTKKKISDEIKMVINISPKRVMLIEPRRSVTLGPMLPFVSSKSQGNLNEHSITPTKRLKFSTQTIQEIPEVPKKPIVSRCPVHSPRGLDTLRNCSIDVTIDGPCPVGVLRSLDTYGLIISPLLTDDESGVEFSREQYHLKCKPMVNMPPSPALCICSDVEEEELLQLKANKIETSSALFVMPRVNETSSLPQKRDTLSSILNTIGKHIDIDECVDDLDETFVEKEAGDQPAVDSDYQNRVLESFSRRLATMKTGHDIGSESRTSLQTQYQHSSNSRETSKPETDSSEGQNGQSIEGHFDRGSNTSPIWKRQLVAQNGMCPLRECTYGMHYHHDCLLCSGQLESDTIQSSSSGMDCATNPSIRHCYCRLQSNCPSTDTQVRSSLVYSLLATCLSRLRNIFLAPVHLLAELGQTVSHNTRVKNKAVKQHKERGRRENRARKALRTITFILGAFVLCWTPYHIVIIIKGICDDPIEDTTCVDDILYSITYWLCYMNSPINPFCYALANAQFKKTFLRIFHGDFRRI